MEIDKRTRILAYLFGLPSLGSALNAIVFLVLLIIKPSEFKLGIFIGSIVLSVIFGIFIPKPPKEVK